MNPTMLKIIIIEDEKNSTETLLGTLAETSDKFQVEGLFSTVRESLDQSGRLAEADIIFSDIQLPDGLSFEIFSQLNLNVPVIFVTGYDEFMMNAFEYNGIDYLLKPVTKTEIDKAIAKYKMLEKHFVNSCRPIHSLLKQMKARQRERLLVRRGLENIPLRLEEVAIIF